MTYNEKILDDITSRLKDISLTIPTIHPLYSSIQAKIVKLELKRQADKLELERQISNFSKIIDKFSEIKFDAPIKTKKDIFDKIKTFKESN